MGPLKIFGSSQSVQQWAHCKLLTTCPGCANWPIHLSWQFFQSASMAHPFILAVLSMGPRGIHQCNRSIYLSWQVFQSVSMAHPFILAVLSMGPLMIYAHCYLKGPCGFTNVIGIFTLCLDCGPTQDIQQL